MSGWIEAGRRLVQFLMVFIPFAVLLSMVWNILTFPQDAHPWLLVLALTVTAAVPISIWWRQFFPTRASSMFRRGVAVLAIVVGLAMFLACLAWIGFLLTGPYSGPMSAEATIYFGTIAVLGATWGLLLAFCMRFLDPRPA